ncbi:hypothetical protein F5Y11DRAFT_355841 [Daldinia sp. FL1419]|nr:hypothetical protein F5Y11DRAFT_355841 [Daldinia sp. FL1419]
MIVLGNLVNLLRDLLPVPPLATLLRERFLTHVREAAQNLHRYQEHKRPIEAAVKAGRKGGLQLVDEAEGDDTEAYVDTSQISKMLINPKAPQPVWTTLPNDGVFPYESHLRCECQEDCSEAVRRLEFIHCTCGIARLCNGIIYQLQLKRAMDDQSLFQNMAADSGDEAYLVRSSPSPLVCHQSRNSCLPSQPEEYYNSDYLPSIDTRTPFTGTQTTAAGVSGINAGRDFDPSQPQHNKGSVVNEPVFQLRDLRATNAYPREFGANYDGRQFSVHTCDMNGRHQTANYLEYTDGMPSGDWPSTIFGEPLEGTQVSPSSFSSSVPSLATSEAMAAMTLDPMAVHNNAAGHLQANSSIVGQGTSVNAWASSSYPSTISPKMLRINPSPTPASSSESVHNSMLAGSDLDLGNSAYEHQHPRSPFQAQRQIQKPRKELPSKPTRPRLVPVVSEPPSSSSKGKRPALPQLSADHGQSPQKVRSPYIKHEHQDTTYQAGEGSSPRGRGRGGTTRSAKDDFLVRSKLAGMTYREIRREGNFTEAESTLRGRFRTLTKDKEARVRKPEWQDNDVRLLKKAVRKLSKNNEMMPAKAPWGQVAEYIMDHGGSYQFGGATCHRKWKELEEDGKVGLK